METRAYFEKVMQDYNQRGNGRSLRKYCMDEGVNYPWLMKYKKSYKAVRTEPKEAAAVAEAQPEVERKDAGELVALAIEERFAEEKEPEPMGWRVERLMLGTPSGETMEITCTNLLAVSELLRKMS